MISVTGVAPQVLPARTTGGSVAVVPIIRAVSVAVVPKAVSVHFDVQVFCDLHEMVENGQYKLMSFFSN